MRQGLFALGVAAALAGCTERPVHRRRDAIGAPATNVSTESDRDRSSLGPHELADRTRNEALRAARQRLTLVGTIRRAGDDQVTLERPGGEPFVLDLQTLTTVRMNGRPVTPRALPEGAEVRASYAVDGPRRLAASIEVLRAWPDRPPGRRGR